VQSLETLAHLCRCNWVFPRYLAYQSLPKQRTHIFGAFAAALQRREFSTPDPKCLVAATVQEAVAKLGETFRANVGYNPSHGVGSHTLHPLLARQFKGMQNLDPPFLLPSSFKRRILEMILYPINVLVTPLALEKCAPC